jgi:hypothetical protein
VVYYSLSAEIAVMQPQASTFPARANSRPSPVPAHNVHSPRQWGCGLLARLLRRLTFPLFVTPFIRSLAWIRIEGREHLSSFTGPVIFACNHQSDLDTYILLAALPGLWRYRTAISIRDECFGGNNALMRALHKFRFAFSVLHLNAFTLSRTPFAFRQSLHHMLWLARNGWSMLVYPEGERSSDGSLLPFQAGIGRMAASLQIPVVPVRLDGAVLQRSLFKFLPGPVRVRFGAPLNLDGFDPKAITDRVELAIRSLQESL